MAEKVDEKILSEIQDKYVPFLKKLIGFLEKTKKATPENLTRLKSIHEIFTTAPVHEQVEVFHANRKKLEKWYQNSQKGKNAEGTTIRGMKRALVMDDTDSSQGVSEVSASKRSNFKGAVSEQPPKLSISSVQSVSTSNAGSVLLTKIKQEKIDSPVLKVNQASKPVPATNANSPAAVVPIPAAPAPATPAPVAAAIPSQQQQSTNPSDPITFTCASCQFQTLDETEFMKHARTDHRTDLSMWCKQCGKCFSNAGVLVSHIKERACIKEEMIYRCGVKDCAFETTSGQTFVHHLRHCHKGSPFIFCVHCQKIFTLPHCLILHMQDDCPFKEKNRRIPGGGQASEAESTSAPQIPARPTFTPPTITAIRPQTPTVVSTPRVVAASAVTVTPPAAVPSPSTRGRGIMPFRGRGARARGRGRGRPPSESSDSDDPDDPSWRPEETLGQTGLRRSGRWAKKLSDVINVEPSVGGELKTQKKSMSLAELNSTEMLNCPCCDFMAAFKSVLEDHYIAHHKVPNKNACVVCHLKFESTQCFINHFEEHQKGNLVNRVVVPEPTEVASGQSKTVESPAPAQSPAPAPPVETESSSQSIASTNAETRNSNDSTLTLGESFEGVVKNISEANIDSTVDKSKIVKIPYQAAIHDKNLKESKLKKFEELKSPNDLVAMKNEEKLKHFFKCVSYNCSFTTNDNTEFYVHLDTVHNGKRLHCGYCLKEFYSGEPLSEHMIAEHGKRLYQCSNCFYRAYSKIHVQIHIKNYHANDTNTEVYTCVAMQMPGNLKIVDDSEEKLNTTWPYICAIGDCDFQTFDPKEFKRHNETVHRSVSVFFCHYCKVDFISFKRLLNHYRLHGINTFQCNYCIHGSETKDEIMLHLCNAHADQPLQAYMRGTEEDASSEAMQLPLAVAMQSSSAANANTAAKPVTASGIAETESASPLRIDATKLEKKQMSFESELYHIFAEKYYPKSLRHMCSNLFCGIPYCEEKFENILTYVGHLRNVHAAINFPCPHCPTVSETWSDFKNHLMCHGPDLFACGYQVCDFCDWNENKLDEHVKNHPVDSCKVIIVRKSFAEIEQSNEISKIKSLPRDCPFKVGDEYFECLFCRYKSSNLNIMKNHMYSELRYKRFSCTHCNVKCISSKAITDHFVSVHSGYDVECVVDSIPEVEYVVKKVLIQKITYPDLKSEQCCNNCYKKFKSFVQWQRHLNVCLHKQYRPYDCGYCRSSYSDVKILKYHIDEKHLSKPLLFSQVSSFIVEEEISKKLLQLRLKYLSNFYKASRPKTDENSEAIPQMLKVYACSICSYESNHKFNVENHIKKNHEDENAEIKKRFGSVSQLNADENSNDSLKEISELTQAGSNSQSKRYRCGFCVKKMHSLRELESHVEGHHPVKDESEYLYYYSPDPKIKFSPDDKEMYECAYCKSGKEKLSSLKTHADLMHSDTAFKVKGFVNRNRERPSIVGCGYCYVRLESLAEFKRHFISCHPSQPQKSIDDFQGTSLKRIRENTRELPNKRVKLGANVFVCSHCGAAYSSEEQVATHTKRAHSRLELEFKVISKVSADGDAVDVKFYKCEFCHFTGEKCYLEKHLSTKHKMRVTCSYCNKRFEFATKLKEHHDVIHKGLPVKYSQETVGPSFKTEQKYSVSSDSSNVPCQIKKNPAEQPIIPEEGISHYGKRPEPIDLSTLSVLLEENGHFSKISLVYFSQLFPIFPKVILKDIKKE